MRLSVSYGEDHIYPLEVYGPLQSLLLQSLEAAVGRRGERGDGLSEAWFH